MQEISVKVEQKSGVIGFNFEEIKSMLETEMRVYKGMIFTEDSKKEAKEMVASLRKLKKSVDDKRKEVKKEFMVPYEEFENRVKELNALIDEPIRFISMQVEEFEQKRLEEKRQLIRQLYSENIGDMAEILPLEKIYDVKWENSTATKKSIMDEIQERVLSVKADLETIRSLGSAYEDKGIAVYTQTLSLNNAIQKIRNYERQEAEIKARKKEEKRAKVIAVPMQEVPKVPVREDVATYEVKADRFQIVQLEAAMREFGIKYRRL